MKRGFRPAVPDGVEQHRDWLSLIDVTGPFLSLPVLRSIWPTLDPLDKPERQRLRTAHTAWRDAPAAGQRDWIRYVLTDLLGWGEALHTDELDAFTIPVAEHDTDLTPSFVLVTPDEEVKPDSAALLGLTLPAGSHPTARVPGSPWAATPADRLAHLCRHHGVELGLVTDGRWWALVWAPRGGVTTTAVFDAVSWDEATERGIVRAFLSLLHRRRFFQVRPEERLVALLRESLDKQEEITEALGVNVRRAVELLVTAISRADARERDRGEPGLAGVSAHEVYRGAVAVMMRVVFLLFAEEKGLLPADNDLYAAAYSAGGLCGELEQRATEGSEDELEHGFSAWHRLLALFTAVYSGVEHERLTVHAHDGSLFDPKEYAWLPLSVDDRTVLHMLRAVQYVEIGTGRSRERRKLTFATLDVEQIGYVYEGLLSYEGFRADQVTVGLIGKEGLEEEVPLADLETLAERHHGPETFAAALAEAYKDSKIGTPGALAKALAPLDSVQREEARKRLLAVTAGDYPLAERLLAFARIIRHDLRDLPVVILPGALYVTESALRRNTGTHYTPRFLAEEVVEHALEPLVYEPGPLQTADRSQWKHKSSAEILSLKVADIAMGSAAFLVAAARYLGNHLLEAWRAEGDPRVAQRPDPADVHEINPDTDPVVIEARRQVIEHCLYGVDINPMAVEMAKLSLWLVSMDSHRPFTFLDDRLVAGDSLLGITSLDQLEYMHLDPRRGRALHEDFFQWANAARSLVAEAATDRRAIAEIGLGDEPMAALAHKRVALETANAKTERLRLFADLVAGAALANSRKAPGSKSPRVRTEARQAQEKGRDGLFVTAARLANEVSQTSEEDPARDQVQAWLATDQVAGGFARQPLHWPLVFPEVFDREHGGFDAIIGNPPFLGGKKISGSTGSAYREYLVEAIAHGVKGNADLVAYFVLRAHDLLNRTGQAGLIATNTLTQGDTREVGLDQLVADSVTIRRAVKSKPWPSRSAVLEYCAIWTSCSLLGNGTQFTIGEQSVAGITSALDPLSRSTGIPHRLAGSARIAFIGNFVNGIGFVLSENEKVELVELDSKSAEILFPYLNGQDLNTRPDTSASRYIIDFQNWSLARASQYPLCLDRIRRLVKPARDKLPDLKRATRERWWQYEHLAPGLRNAIAGLERVIAITRVSKTVMPVMVPTSQVISEAVVVFATDDTAMLAFLSSAPHYWWTVSRASSMRTDLRYTPSDVFETLPLPDLTPELRTLGDRLDSRRREIMLARQAGLTATYNLVHNPDCHDDDIAELRQIHHAIDEAVCRAYHWDDLIADLDHGFHDLGRETRYTIGPAARREILDRLLELNHARHAEEIAGGAHDKKKAARPAKARSAAKQDSDQPSLFDPEMTGTI